VAAVTSMLSRVLAETECDFSLVAWRSINAVRALPPPPGPEPDADLPATNHNLLAAEIEQKERHAYESGRREGAADAKRQADSEVREVIERLAATIAEVAGARNDTFRRAEADIVQLSVEIARRILHRELSLDTSALDALIRAALDKLRSQEVFRVRVHPDQEQLIRACLQRLGRDSSIEVVGDRAQSLGGALFETSRGSLDASVDTQLREIERGLADRLGERS
jgi:flagellar assembly protein FliH